MHKNMKIEINEQQPIDEVIKQLERLRYKKIGWIGYRNPSFITTNTKGFYTDHVVNFTTLAELKEM